MLAVLSHRGLDGSDSTTLPAAILGHQHFWTTPEEFGERQPLINSQLGLYLVFDGRLDNREDLLQALSHSHGLDPQISDAALLLSAYEAWGTECFRRLLGPFACVLFDEKKRRMICGRDPLGERPLFYFLTPHLFVAASEESAILAHPSVPQRVNEGRVAAYFAVDWSTEDATYFEDIQELSPAHYMMIEEGCVRSARYWDLEPGRRIRYRTDDEYGEHFRMLLAQAVSCRLRAPTAPAVMMSGGLDSSSVAALAAEELAAVDGGRLQTISYVFDELASCDERGFMEAMHAKYHTDVVQIRGDDCWPLSNLDRWPYNPSMPNDNPYRPLKEVVYSSAGSRGHRTLLTGVFGDHMYSGTQHWLKDLVLDGWLRLAFLESRSQLRHVGPWYLIRQYFVGVIPALEVIRRRRLRPKPDWLTEPAKGLLLDASRSHTAARTGYRPDQCESLLGLRAAFSSSRETFHASRLGIDLRHPYRDRRLIEFMLSIPAHQLYRGGLYKHVLREGMKGVLPERIRTRRYPTSLTPLFVRGVAEKGKTIVDELLNGTDKAWSRYVRADWLLATKPGARRRPIEELVLWQCICFEIWQMKHKGLSL